MSLIICEDDGDLYVCHSDRFFECVLSDNMIYNHIISDIHNKRYPKLSIRPLKREKSTRAERRDSSKSIYNLLLNREASGYHTVSYRFSGYVIPGIPSTSYNRSAIFVNISAQDLKDLFRSSPKKGKGCTVSKPSPNKSSSQLHSETDPQTRATATDSSPRPGHIA